MNHQWRDFPRLAENPAEARLNIDCGPTTRRKNFLAALLNALHESRRLQAKRVIHQYQYLIAADRSFKP